MCRFFSFIANKTNILLKIYRDCLKVANIVGLKTNTSAVLRKHVRTQFKKNKYVTNKEEIDSLRAEYVPPINV